MIAGRGISVPALTVPFASLLVGGGFHEWVAEPCARLGKQLSKGVRVSSGARWSALGSAR